MGSTKQISLIFCTVVAFIVMLAMCPAANVGAIKSPTSVAENPNGEEEPVDEAERLKAITSNCSDIKYALTQLQRVDSRTRTYLGTSYETISSRFITPLNLRLERNNRPSEQLLNIQSEFLTTHSNFRLAYTDYMRDLESLITIDCTNQPEEFYKQLESTRTKRAALQTIVKKLNALANEQYKSFVELEKKL